jgi:hypothetical protein
MTTQIKLRRDTGTNWDTNSTVVLGEGEIGVNLTNGQFKLGDGISTWAQLSYFQPGASGGLSITDFGLGFVDNLDAGKITTSKLYNENPNQGLNNQYTLEVTNGGVVALPDGSIINGATLKTIAGNYAGITAGPASPAGKDEDSWVWVDNDGATIATKYSTDNHTWTFNNNGNLTLPAGGDILDSNGDSVLGGGSNSYTPDDTDNWNEPTINTISAALDELAARMTAFENFEIDGGNANTPALGELIIDGNNGA